MPKHANRLSSLRVALLASLFVGFIALVASPASAQSRGEVVDPFSETPTASQSELLDPFADAPALPRRARTALRTTDLLDPFASTARRAARFLAELLNPWSD